jgi:hypothetical protein
MAWNNPQSSQPDFSQTYYTNNNIVISWSALNNSIDDLWLSPYDASDTYSLRIATFVNLTDAGSLAWTVFVDETENALDNRFKFSFVPAEIDFQSAQLNKQTISSPGFLILRNNQGSSIATSLLPTGTSTALIVSSTADSFSASPTYTADAGNASQSSSSSGLGTSAKAGISIAVIAVTIIFLGLVIWIARLRRRVRAVKNHRSAGIISPSPESKPEMSETAHELPSPVVGSDRTVSSLQELVGDRRQPTELDVENLEDVIPAPPYRKDQKSPPTTYHELE